VISLAEKLNWRERECERG